MSVGASEKLIGTTEYLML